MKKAILLTLCLIGIYMLAADIVINEIMYNSSSYDNEWVELYNTSAQSVNLAGWYFIDENEDGTHQNLVITSGTIAGNGYFTIAVDHDPQAEPFPFDPDFDGIDTINWNLANGGDDIFLYNASGQEMDHVLYDDTAPWPTAPDGNGPSLELTDPALDNNVGSNWHASAVAGGTPGAQNSGGGGGDDVDVATIGALRSSPADGTTVYRLTGQAILTFQQTFRNQKWVQDATGGVLIDDYNGIITTTYTLYDGIANIRGTLTEYGGLLEFTPVADPGAAASHNNTINPPVITIAEYNSNFEAYESELVRINGVNFTTTGTFANGQTYPISDGTGTANFRTTFYDVDYIGTAIPTTQVGLIGIPNSRTTGNFFSSRSLADIVVNANDPALSVTPNPVSFGYVEYGEEYFEEVTLQNTGGSQLVLQSVSSDNPQFDTDFSGTVTLEVSQQGTLIISCNPVEADRDIVVSATLTFSGNFGTFMLPVSYTIQTAAAGVMINEIMYNSAGYDNEWIELYNADATPVDLSGWSMLDDDASHEALVFPEGSEIAAHGYFTIALDHDPQADPFPFVADFDALEVAQWNLNNTGDTIHLLDAQGNEVDLVVFSDTNGWPTEPDGTGPSLELINPSLDNNLVTSWQASAVEGGTPGEVNSGGAQIIEVATIGQLRQQAADGSTVYRVTGQALLSFQQTWRNQKYFQDTTGGILIDDYNSAITTTYNVGDAVVGLSGTLAVYGNMLQLSPNANPGAPVSSGNVVAAEPLTIPQLIANYDQYESKLIKLQNVHFVDTGDFTNGYDYIVADASGNEISFRCTFYDVDYIGTTIPVGDRDLLVLPNARDDGDYITARSIADIQLVGDADDESVEGFKSRLLGNFPNPFNPTTNIRFQLNQPETVELVVYNVQGQKVRTLCSEKLNAGTHDVVWNGNDENGRKVSSGLYFYQLKSGSMTHTGKALLLK